MTLLGILCLLPTHRASIGSTPEWAAYERELAKHGSIHVDLFFPPPQKSDGSDDESFQLDLRSTGDFVASMQRREIKWVKGRGIIVDRFAKTWKPISKVVDTPDSLSMLGLLRGDHRSDEEWDAAWKMTREPYVSNPRSNPGSGKEIGYLLSSYHVDAGFAAAWWFDTKTHLVTQIEMQSLGPMAEYSIRRSMYVHFEFNKKPLTKIDLRPPAGYKEAK